MKPNFFKLFLTKKLKKTLAANEAKFFNNILYEKLKKTLAANEANFL